MKNCTKFASIWMKFSNISLPTGPQAADPALPLNFKMGTSSSYVAPNCFRTQNPKSHVLKLRFARHKAKASEKIYSQPDFEFQASPSPLYLWSWEQWAAFAHVNRLYVHSYSIYDANLKLYATNNVKRDNNLVTNSPASGLLKISVFMIARSKISVSQRQLFQTASQRKLIGKKFYYI